MHRILAVLLLLLASAAVHAKEELVRSNLQVLEYNSVAQQYMPRPTTITVRGNPGKQDLLIRYDNYGMSNDIVAGFTAKNVDAYLEHVAKFLKWAAMATANGDAFEKEIGIAPSFPGIKLKFSFFSGNPSSHFLVVAVCSLGNCSVGKPMYFDVAGATELQNLLTKLKAGELPGEDVGAKYN